MVKLVLLRHGESTWNRQNRFTGWTDVGLTEKGIREAKDAGKALKKHGYGFDAAFTNLHKRSINTLNIVMQELGTHLPVKKSWRLNERHYGALQGLNKAEMARKFGEAQVLIWRRSYSTRPPELKKSDNRYKKICGAYPEVEKKYVPVAESLKDTVRRFLPYWKASIAPSVKEGRKVLIVASHNSLRALAKHLDKIPDKDIPHLNIPTGIPMVYELDAKLKPLRHYFIGDKRQIEKKLQAVAAQGRAK